MSALFQIDLTLHFKEVFFVEKNLGERSATERNSLSPMLVSSEYLEGLHFWVKKIIGGLLFSFLFGFEF
jgi:hypothetical protein